MEGLAGVKVSAVRKSPLMIKQLDLRRNSSCFLVCKVKGEKFWGWKVLWW